MRELKPSWIFLIAALIAVGWGIWLKKNENVPEPQTIKWVRRDGKLVENISSKPYQGIQEIPFEDAQELIQWEYHYVDGVRQGPAIEFYPSIDKRVRSRSTYINGVIQGPVTTYHTNGVTLSKGIAVDGFIEGIISFYDSDGIILYRDVYTKTAPSGLPAVTTNPVIVPEPEKLDNLTNDAPQGDEDLVKLQLDPEGTPFTGTQIGTFHDGTKAFEHSYKDGREHGPHNAWTPEGSPEYQREFFEGKKHGNWKVWSEANKVVIEESYHYGLQIGTAKRWHPNNQLRQESEFIHGAEHGIRQVLGPRGRKRRNITFDHGIQTHLIEWNSDGSISEEIDTPLPDGLTLTIPQKDQSHTELITLPALPADLDATLLVSFRYRLSTQDPEPPANAARPFRVALLVNGKEQGFFKFKGELGGWRTYQWILNATPEQSLTIEIKTDPGELQLDLAGIRFQEDAEP